jgi:halocyanin-like protein
MTPSNDGIDVGRRRALRTIAAGVAAGGFASLAAPTAAQSTDLSAWFSSTGNADSVTDRTGKSKVTVEVGTSGNGSAFGFGPAVVRVDPGTTVVWEWTGKGGSHNVVAEDGSLESDLLGDEGATFEHTFESAGVTKYACTPHKTMGMKGAVVVGDAEVTLGASGSGSATATPTAAGSSGGGSGDAAAGGDASQSFDYGGWFEGVSNFDGTVDKTGRDEVTIAVGASGNDGNFAFEPAAVQVDPGTTVVWEWTGKGGDHNVVAQDLDVESPMQGEEGATHAAKFDGAGIAEYVCTPHEAMGMKGAVVVGNPAQSTGIDWLKTSLVGLAGAIVAGPFVASEVAARRRRDDDEPPRRPTHPSD